MKTGPTAAKAAKKTSRAKGPAPTAREAGKRSDAQPGKTAPAAETRADGLRAGTKTATMLDMVLRPGGATESQICAAIGWKKCRVTLKRTCDKVGAVLSKKRDGDDGPFFYCASMPRKER